VKNAPERVRKARLHARYLNLFITNHDLKETAATSKDTKMLMAEKTISVLRNHSGL